MKEFILDTLGLIGIAIVLFAIFWFFLPPWMSRPLPKKEPKGKLVVVMQPDYSLREDEISASHEKMKSDANHENKLPNYQDPNNIIGRQS